MELNESIKDEYQLIEEESEEDNESESEDNNKLKEELNINNTEKLKNESKKNFTISIHKPKLILNISNSNVEIYHLLF